MIKQTLNYKKKNKYFIVLGNIIKKKMSIFFQLRHCIMIMGPDDELFEQELHIKDRIKTSYIQSLNYSLNKISNDIQEIESIFCLNEDNYRLFSREYRVLLQKKLKIENELSKEEKCK